MGCGATSGQNPNVIVPQKPTAEKQETALAQQTTKKHRTVNKKGPPQAITGQNGKFGSAANTTKQMKLFNPQDMQETTPKRQVTSRDSKNQSKGRVGVKSSHRSRQPISEVHATQIIPNSILKKVQLAPITINSKIVVNSSKNNLKTAESQHQEHTTAEDETLSRNDKQGRYDKHNRYGQLDLYIKNELSSTVTNRFRSKQSRINDTNHKEVQPEKKKKTMKQSQSKKRNIVDPKLNALIQIYGFE